MSHLYRPLVFIAIALLITIVPFLFFGERIEQWFQQYLDHPPSTPVTVALIVGGLATDIFLPIPSSLISTMAGSQLGKWLGTGVSWLGMSLGAVIGFALSRRWGESLANRLSQPEEIENMRRATAKYGPLILVVMRGVPVLAEASVLFVGASRMPWKLFLPPILLSNLGIALAYAVLGSVATDNEWLPVAMAISLALPFLLAAFARQMLINR